VDRYKDFRSGLSGEYDGTCIISIIARLSVTRLSAPPQLGLFALSDGTEGIALFWKRDNWYISTSKNVSLGENTVGLLAHLEARTNLPPLPLAPLSLILHLS